MLAGSAADMPLHPPAGALLCEVDPKSGSREGTGVSGYLNHSCARESCVEPECKCQPERGGFSDCSAGQHNHAVKRAVVLPWQLDLAKV